MAQEVMRKGYSEMYEQEYIREDGTVFPVELRTCLVTDSRGEPAGTWTMARDVSRRKAMEHELRQTKEYLEKVIENAVDAIGIVDRQGKFIMWNRRAEEIFGYAASDMKGNSFVHVYADKRELERMLAVLKRDGVVREYEMATLKKDGHTVPMELSIKLLKDEAGATMGSVCVARDLTEKKSMEAQLLHAVKMEAVGTLSGGIAHDFNNLLQAIHGYAELLLFDREPDGDGYAELREIVQAARKGGDLTRQLLTFSRKVQSELRPVDLNQEVRKAATLLGRTLPKMIRIELRLEPGVRTVSGDPNQIEQILVNFALNARDAMPDGGSLTIGTGNVTLDEEFCRSHPEVKAGEHVLLSMSDTGLGMDEETLLHIFDPFFTTKEVGKGTGLGLSTVYGIVKNHRGHIECESVPGVGTTFNVYLPAVHSVESFLEAEKSFIPQRGSETILIVDDEDFVLDLCGQVLTRYGYTVLTASDGESALDIYAREKDRIDLVILDLIMPGMGGRECLAELLEINPLAKVIFVSGYLADASPVETRESGARAFVRKPFRSAEMLDVVREVLDRG
jgi:PAS domain S-box-containing protein